MRILHILQPDRGGAETVVRLLVREQLRRHAVGVVCPPTGVLAHEAAALGARVWTLSMVREVRPVRDLRHLLEIGRVIRRFRPDIVHAHSSKAGVLGRVSGRALRVPVVYSPQNFAYRAHEGGPVARGFYYGVERALRPLTSFLHAASHDEYRDALARKTAVASRCATVHNGVYTSPVADLPPRRSPTLVVGTYSRLNPQKDPANLVRAAACLRNQQRSFQCLVIGEGPLRSELERLALELGLDALVRFEPDPGNPRSALSRLDIYVLPSRTEACPLGLIEAMAAGRAVVATRVGGVPELVRDGRNGLLVPAAHPEALAEAIGRLLEDEKLRRSLGEVARDDAIRRFAHTRMAGRLESIYESTLGLEKMRV